MLFPESFSFREGSETSANFSQENSLLPAHPPALHRKLQVFALSPSPCEEACASSQGAEPLHFAEAPLQGLGFCFGASSLHVFTFLEKYLILFVTTLNIRRICRRKRSAVPLAGSPSRARKPALCLSSSQVAEPALRAFGSPLVFARSSELPLRFISSLIGEPYRSRLCSQSLLSPLRSVVGSLLVFTQSVPSKHPGQRLLSYVAPKGFTGTK